MPGRQKRVARRATISKINKMNNFEKLRHRNMSMQLGMPRGTAAGRLRKLVLFSVLKRHGENICFRCGKEIESAEELSIEHKLPWEGIDVALFWNIDNIAFSHLLCNIKAVRRPSTRPHHRKKSPNGMAWCTTCKRFLPVERFAKMTSRWNGRRFNCRKCEKKYKDKIRSCVRISLRKTR